MSWKRNVIFEAKKIIEMYPNKRSALGPLLYLALREEGYITDESISEISSLIGITEAQVQSVATFYTISYLCRLPPLYELLFDQICPPAIKIRS